MTTINTVEEIIEALDTNPALMEALRARLLTRELLEMPERLAAFEVATNTRLDALEASHVRLENTLQQFIETTNRRFDSLEVELRGLRDDVADIKGFHAREIVTRRAAFIPRGMGFRLKEVLSIVDILDILHDADTSGIAEGDLESFGNADLIMSATDSEGAECYIPVEVSFTIFPRDTERAIRNAEFLTRFTGLPAHPAVAGMQVDWRAQDTIDSQEVFFHRVPVQLLKAD